MFLNRTDEIAALVDSWHARDAQFVVLWGRRRVGKTELLTRFAEQRRALHFEATDTGARDQLGDLSRELARVWGNELLAAEPVTGWDAALTAIEGFVGKTRTLVVLDEFQYLAAHAPGLGSTINRWWRQRGRRLPIVLVLAGSEVGFFEREVLGGQMYGRRTGQLQLLPFHYRDAALFHPGYTAEDRVRAFAICGGMPYYLERFRDDAPLREQVLRHTLYRDGFLFEEADLLLRQELPDPHNYVSVLRAIAQGHTQVNTMAQRAGLDRSRVSQMLTTLERMQLVRKNRPATASVRSKKTAYAITDGFLNYFFRFVDPARSRLRTRAQAERYLDEVVMPQLDHFVSRPTWEAIAHAYVRDREPDAASVGAWWGPVPTGVARRTRQQEIDVVAVDFNGEVIATGACKWTKGKLGLAEETLLTETEPHIPNAHAVRRHYLFAPDGFGSRLRTLAANDPERYRLVSPADVYA